LDPEFTSLLNRQVKRYLKENTLLTSDLKELLEAVNRSYKHYERDHILGKQSLEISSSELQQLAEELKDRENFTRAVLDAASDGILVIDENQNIVICNPAAALFLGFKDEKNLLGKSLNSLFPIPEKKSIFELSLKKEDESDLSIEVSSSEIIVHERKVTLFVLRDMTIHKESEKTQKRELELQKQLVTVARQAGMMQVATSILHNIGNVLTTLNISVTLLQEIISFSELNHFPKIAHLIEEHKENLVGYLFQDPKGKFLPEFIVVLAQLWEKENLHMRNELDLIEKNVQHIKNIIKLQQSMSGTLGIKEKVEINHLLDELVAMEAKEFEKYDIEIFKEYSDIPEISLDRGRLMQILVNIIRNALDALKEQKESKKIIYRTVLVNQKIRIEISDTGCGIDKKNLINIFSYGFTTKKEGHGFGLHTSAILAREMGGQLIANSEGVGKGATFTLILSFQEIL
jgi:PAS domain S-box-containing protein